MAAPVHTGIVTPEAVVLDFDTAGAGSRVLAEGLDVVIQLIGLILLLVALSSAAATVPVADWIPVVLGFAALFATFLGYPTVMETLWGRTLGKAAFGLRVVTVEGGPIRFRHAAVRAGVGLIEIWAFLGLPALVAIVLSKRNQRLGDMVGGTLVLRERTASRTASAMVFAPPVGYEAYVESLDVAAMEDREYQVVRNFLVRVGQLLPVARANLAVLIANPIAMRLQHQPPEFVGPELYLACVASAYQQRHGWPEGRPPTPGWDLRPPPPPPGSAWSAPPPPSADAPGSPSAPPPPSSPAPPPPPGSGRSAPAPPVPGWVRPPGAEQSDR